MAILTKARHLFCKFPLLSFHFSQFVHSLPSPSSSSKTLENSIKTAIQTKTYHQIPNLLTSISNPNPNPFSFLSSFTQPHRTQIIDEILQSFLHLRPRSRLFPSYSHLLSLTFQNPNPIVISLLILQRILRSGFLPNPQTRLSLSTAWLHYRRLRSADSIGEILSDMKSSGYRPDLSTFNYLISSLCAVDQLEESVLVLKSMGGVGCGPDSESYGAVIGAMCKARRSEKAADMVKEMVVEDGVTPRQGTVVKVVAAMRSNREVRMTVELVEMLEREGVRIGFEGYEVLVEGCLEMKEFVLAGKVVVKMVEKGYIPYIKVRQKVLEGLAGVGEWKFACHMREKLAEVRC